jgi:hypothetical protein
MQRRKDALGEPAASGRACLFVDIPCLILAGRTAALDKLAPRLLKWCLGK